MSSANTISACENAYNDEKYRFQINVFYSENDQAWVADIPDLQYCSAFGSTPLEAMQEILVARALWLESAIQLGMPIPTPSFRPGSP